MPQRYTVDDAVFAAGFGPFQLRLLLLAGLAWAADAAEVMLLAFAAPAVSCHFGLDQASTATLTSAVFVGMLIGAACWGSLADRYGRKRILLGSSAVSFIAGILSAMAPTFGWLIALRLAVGFGVAGAHVALTLLAEFLPAKRRAMNLVLLEVFWAVGSMFEALLASAVMPGGDVSTNWRFLLGFSSAPLLLLCAAYPFIPESARYLLVRGRHAEAVRVLEKMCKMNGVAMQTGELVLSVDAADGSSADSENDDYGMGHKNIAIGVHSGRDSFGGVGSKVGSAAALPGSVDTTEGPTASGTTDHLLGGSDDEPSLQASASIGDSADDGSAAAVALAHTRRKHARAARKTTERLDRRRHRRKSGKKDSAASMPLTSAQATTVGSDAKGARVESGDTAAHLLFMSTDGSSCSSTIQWCREKPLAALKASTDSFTALLSKPLRRTTLLLWVIWFTNAFVYYGMVLLTTEMAQLERRGDRECGYDDLDIAESAPVAENSTVAGEKLCTRLEFADYMQALLLATAELPGVLLTLFVIDVVGRKATQGGLFLGATVFVSLLLLCLGRTAETVFMFVARGLITGAFQASYVYTPEVYPTPVRSTGLGVCSSMARIGGVTTPFIAQSLADSSLAAAILVYVGVLVAGTVSAFFLPFETKGQDLVESFELVEQSQLQHKRVRGGAEAKSVAAGVTQVELESSSGDSHADGGRSAGETGGSLNGHEHTSVPGDLSVSISSESDYYDESYGDI